MAEKNFNIKKVIDYWSTSAAHNHGAARFLLQGKHYPESLFFCHLMIEKILKALVIRHSKTHAPYIHKLVDLAILAGVSLSSEQISDLTTITEFNIATRYDEAKFQFYKKCTKAYTEKYFTIAEDIYLWFKKQLFQKK